MDAQMERKARRRVIIGTLLTVAMVVAAKVISGEVVMFMDLPANSMWAPIISEAVGAAAAVLGMMLLGGASWISCSKDDVFFTFRFGWWCLAISAAIMLMGLSEGFFDSSSIAPEWVGRALELALFCLLVGIFEEAVFRGVIFGALLAFMGRTHRGVVWAILITSFLFGVAHVDLSVAFVSASTLAQAVLKTVQTGLYSFLLCVIVLRTRRLGGVSLFHGIDDLMILFPSVVLLDTGVSVQYISTGEDDLLAIVYYLVIIALYLPFVIKSVRELRRGKDVYQGVFMERYVGEAAQMTPDSLPVPGMGREAVPASAPVPPAFAVPSAGDDPAPGVAPVSTPGTTPAEESAPPAPGRTSEGEAPSTPAGWTTPRHADS